jgi:hypothetical protein
MLPHVEPEELNIPEDDSFDNPISKNKLTQLKN